MQVWFVLHKNWIFFSSVSVQWQEENINSPWEKFFWFVTHFVSWILWFWDFACLGNMPVAWCNPWGKQPRGASGGEIFVPLTFVHEPTFYRSLTLCLTLFWQKQATVRSSVLEVLLEITKFCDLYLMERVLDDESEVRADLVTYTFIILWFLVTVIVFA